MSELALVGIDLGKHTFHLHSQDVSGREMFRKKLSRVQMMRFFSNCPTCTVVMEACAGSHFVARELATMGHVTKLISPQFVRPFVKSNKNDFVDAEAICEAASRPSMRFVSPKTEAQQTLSVLHRMRESLVRDRTKTINQLHGFLLEFGISLPLGRTVIKRLPSVLAEHELPIRLAHCCSGCTHTSAIWMSKSRSWIKRWLANWLSKWEMASNSDAVVTSPHP